MLENGQPVAIVSGPKRGLWGYLILVDGVETLVKVIDGAGKFEVIVSRDDVARISFMAVS